MAKGVKGRGNENRGKFSKAQIDLALQLKSGLGGLSPSGAKCWSYGEIAADKRMAVNGEAPNRGAVSAMISRRSKVAAPTELQKADVKSIRLREGELMTQAIGDLLGELVTRDFSEVKTKELPEMISSLVNTRKNNETKSLEEIEAAAVLDTLSKKHAAAKAEAATTIIDMEENEHGSFTESST